MKLAVVRRHLTVFPSPGAAIEHLHEINQCRTLFATHYHELTTLSTKLDRLSNVTMSVKGMGWRGGVFT